MRNKKKTQLGGLLDFLYIAEAAWFEWVASGNRLSLSVFEFKFQCKSYV